MSVTDVTADFDFSKVKQYIQHFRRKRSGLIQADK